MSKTSIRILTVFVAMTIAGVTYPTTNYAATESVSSIMMTPPALGETGAELLSFVAGGVTYYPNDLLSPSLTAYSSESHVNILLGFREAVPLSGNRSQLLTHDLRLDTGIIRPLGTVTEATLTFAPALVNGPGPDLIVFDWSSSGAPRGFQVNVGSQTVIYDSTDYGTPLAPIGVQGFNQSPSDPPASISDLENDFYNPSTTGGGEIFGIAIDLGDFSVGSHESVTEVNFGALTGFNHFSPTLFMGINSAVPEPTTAALALAALCLATSRRRI